jgi:hypothetical protein
MSRRPRCTACKIALDPGADRCPQCLRKSTVVGADGQPLDTPPLDLGRGGGGGGGRGRAAPASPAHVGIRALTLLVAYALCAPLLWLIFAHEAWLEAHALWLPACFAAMALAMMPLRMAFAPPDGPMDSRGAARHYAFRMGFVLVMAAGLFTAQALASAIVTDGVTSIFLGLLFVLAPLLVVPAILTARREKRSIGAVLQAGAKGVGLALAIVLAVAVLVVLRASSHPPPRVIYLPPPDLDRLLDPPDLDDQPDAAPAGRPASRTRAPR